MTHDPLCPHDYVPYKQLGPNSCQCDLIAKVRADELRRPSEDGWMSVRAVLAWEDQVRADERRWVLSSAGRQLRFHVVKDGVCACTINAPDPLEHLAWIIEDYMFTLLPEHETFDWKKKHGQISF